MMSVVNKAAEQNITDLPSRDIPMQQSNISSDPQITPEFIPQSNNIVENDHEIYDELIRRKKQKLHIKSLQKLKILSLVSINSKFLIK